MFFVVSPGARGLNGRGTIEKEMNDFVMREV